MMKGKGFVVVLLVCVATITHAEPTVWYVHPDSTLNSIQAALDACADNDIVLVGSGTYYENIVWPNTQGIHLTSELGPEVTVIDGDSGGRVVTINSGIDTTTVIRGFAIRNGLAPYGGGIACHEYASVTIVENIIENNCANAYYAMGGGILCAYAVIEGNIIRNNLADGTYASGGGICCWGEVIIRGNTITNNTCSGLGGGVHWDGTSWAVFADNIICDNTAYCGGGMCCGTGMDFSAKRKINDNIPRITSPRDTTLFITGNTISGNTASSTYHAGGIHFEELGGIIHNTTITNNMGGGISSSSFRIPPPIAIDSSIVSDNDGNGINSPISTINYCSITGNEGHGVAIQGQFDPYPRTIHYCNIFGNSGYGVRCDSPWVNAENNWWGDATGPYHPDSNPGGQGDSVSDYVDFTPWLTEPVGVKEKKTVKVERQGASATIFSGPLRLPEGKNCRVFDITGRVVAPDKLIPGIYFIEVEGKITQKVAKIR